MSKRPPLPHRRNLRGFLIFISVLLGVLASAHYYFWLRLVHDTGLPGPWSAVATLGLVLAGLSVPTMIFLRLRNSAWFHRLSPTVFYWMGGALLLLLVLSASDLTLGLARLAGHTAQDLLQRRESALGAALFTLALALWARSRTHPWVAKTDIRLAKLPKALDGFRLVQLSDLHVGSSFGHGFVKDVVAKVNELKPDLVVITGDLVDADLDVALPSLAPLKDLQARHGVYYVTGNHEYFHGIHPWLEALPSLGLRLLMNERVRIGSAEAGFDLAGVDDFMGRSVPGFGPDFERALNGRDESQVAVLLVHQPKGFPEALAHKVDLTLAGHTHAGQLWPLMHLVKLDQPYVAGLYQEGGSQLYVNQGTGLWGPRLRLGTRSEISLLTLRSA